VLDDSWHDEFKLIAIAAVAGGVIVRSMRAGGQAASETHIIHHYGVGRRICDTSDAYGALFIIISVFMAGETPAKVPRTERGQRSGRQQPSPYQQFPKIRNEG
jgi:hypothetical protein